MTLNLRIHTTEYPVTVLGPGKRFGVWVQGCCRRCPGCMSPETWDLNGGIICDTKNLAEDYIRSGCDGITISGGEPFLQPEGIADFIQLAGRPGVIIYTGFTYEELLKKPEVFVLLEQCDLLIDGQFIEELRDGKNMRGSSNQRAFALTDKYKDTAKIFGTEPTRIEFFFHNDTTHMIGIPTPEWLAREKANSDTLFANQ